MAVCYKKLWKMLIDKDMIKKDLRLQTGFSTTTMSKLSKNENVSMDVIEKICTVLKCDIGDIMEFVPDKKRNSEEGLRMMADEKIKNSNELEFAVFCIENVAAKLGVDAERVYQAFTEKSNILNGYIVPEYEVLHTQSREYIVDDLLDVMKERGVEV